MGSKRLRKTLPKDLGALMKAASESGDYAAVHTALEACELDARGGYAKGTVLMMRECTPELARWSVERGLDVNATDTYGQTALHASARARFHFGLPPSELIALGANVHATNGEGLTPLHTAADGKHVDAVRVLLSHGADVEATSRRGLTPLGYGLMRMNNVDLVAMVPVVETLLAAGAEVSPEAREFMKLASERFEFHRSGFAADAVAAASDASAALSALLGVAPARPREVHDGTSPIVAQSATWQKQHAELWDFLVPSKGPCATVQGEVVRISGRIGDELNRNGGANWDAQYRAMATAFCEHIGSHRSLSASEQEECRQLARTFPRNLDGTARFCELAVAWVAQNPAPLSLASPTYSR